MNDTEQLTQCVEVDILPVPKYEWTLSVPPGYPAPLPTLDGIGPVATVLAKVAGTYSVSFTGTGDRDCAPVSLPPVLKTTEAAQPDLSLAGGADEDEKNPGGFLRVNDDDDNGNGSPNKVVKRLAAAGLKPERHENRVYFPDPDGHTVQLSAENDWKDWQ